MLAFWLNRPLPHPTRLGWDEILMLAIGLIVLIVIGLAGQKPGRDQEDGDRPAPDREA